RERQLRGGKPRGAGDLRGLGRDGRAHRSLGRARRERPGGDPGRGGRSRGGVPANPGDRRGARRPHEPARRDRIESRLARAQLREAPVRPRGRGRGGGRDGARPTSDLPRGLHARQRAHPRHHPRGLSPMTAMTATREIVAAEPRELVAPSALLGPLAVPRDQVYRFPSGIYGFPDARTFVLLPDDAEGCFWLQSLEHADLTFLLVDPFRFVPGYVVEFAPGTW